MHVREAVLEILEQNKGTEYPGAELARMLGGAKITDTVMESAREMKALAMEKKI